jgi:hypothetical protein
MGSILKRIYNKLNNLIHTKMVYYFESVSKFHYSVFIKGWCVKTDNSFFELKNITVTSAIANGFTWTSQVDANAVRFEIHVLLKESTFPSDLHIGLVFSDDSIELLSMPAMLARVSEQAALSIGIDFREMIKDSSFKKLLDIGGRARSGLDRSKEFPGKEVIVLDIIEGENVDVVGDAHNMSSFLEPNSFDAIYCVSVFEHLIMPWKVAVEMNRVMRMGAIGLIHTHQTIGMHDLPWDFYRYSDTSWKGIFNKHSGFEIVKTQLKELQYIIPFFWRDKYINAEKSAGFEDSTIIVKKIGETALDWKLTADDVTHDMYPDAPDNNIISTA